ncbi:MAG: hypothetical protein IT548_11390 [Alphaproteobacteria bacterium]|nr:hypothetical protein [Alphaproteobacteria bacterium]
MTVLTHHLVAFNTATESENKIHDDEIAGRFGFTGGLVPGVDVFAYMAHIPVAHWGRDWLSQGGMHARFVKPVYDGDETTAHAEAENDDTLALSVTARGTLCAGGSATRLEPGPMPALLPSAAMPDAATRPKASPQSLRPGQVLGTLHEVYLKDAGLQHLKDTREDPALFDDGAIANPAWMLRRWNYVLALNVRLGPWIHSESRIRLHGLLRDGEAVETRAVVHDNVEKGGHLIVSLDVTTSAHHRLVMSGRHWAIYEPRQVREKR